MPQILKEETRKAILRAAVIVFTENDFRDASMQAVARRAGLSPGNLYRYYPDKKALYDAAFPPESLDELSIVLERKIAGWQGLSLAVEPDSDGVQARFRKELIELLASKPEHWIVLLRNGAGEAFADRLVVFFERWLGSLRAESCLDSDRRKTVRLMYRGVVNLMASALGEHVENDTLRAALEDCMDYHMAGLAAITEKWRKE